MARSDIKATNSPAKAGKQVRAQTHHAMGGTGASLERWLERFVTVRIFYVADSTGGHGNQFGVWGKLLWPHHARYSVTIQNVRNRIDSSRARSGQADCNVKAGTVRGRER